MFTVTVAHTPTLITNPVNEYYICGSRDIEHRLKNHFNPRNPSSSLKPSVLKHDKDSHVVKMILALPEWTSNEVFTYFEKKYIERFINLGYTILNKNKEGGRVSRKIRLQQCDKEGKIIKEWESLRSVRNTLGFTLVGLRLALSGKLLNYKGYTWKKVAQDENHFTIVTWSGNELPPTL